MMKLPKEYDPAILGESYHSEQFIYCFDKVVEITKRQLASSYDEALEYVEFNIVGARGENEPIWLYRKF